MRAMEANFVMPSDLSQRFQRRQPRLTKSDHFRLNDPDDCPMLL
jgi:hypothetical protein